MRIVIVGHVDHGKSTLVGRLFHDTGSLPEGKLEAIKAMCERRGMPFEWAFLTDAFQAERDQGITIDTAQIWFRTARRDYTVIDAPGHREFVKNMITGAAGAEAALMLIDAGQGIRQQSRLHAFLLALIGVRQVAVLINKMDLASFSAERFSAIEREYRAYLEQLQVRPTHVIPVSARDGDNIVSPSARMDWYKGPTLVEALDGFSSAASLADLPLRLPVQDIYKLDERRILAGRIESGRLKVGDEILFSPSNKKASIASIEAWPVARSDQAEAGQSIGLTLDEQLFVERGDLISHDRRPPIETNVFAGRIFWLSQAPLKQGDCLTLRLQSREVSVTVQSIERVYDVDSLTTLPARQVERNAIADIVLRAQALLALDEAKENPRTGRFVLSDGRKIVAGGTIAMDGYPDQRGLVTVRSSNLTAVAHRVTRKMRQQRNGYAGGVLWFTGLSGAGKSTIAMAVELELFRAGFQVYVFDGDNIRHGLNANLGFSPEDRAENIRRVGEVAALFADSGQVAITAFISPYRADRERARRAVGKNFHEVYIKADLATCERRDPKGLYRQARAGKIVGFTGVSAPYEPPEQPELIVDTATLAVAEAVTCVVNYVKEKFRSS